MLGRPAESASGHLRDRQPSASSSCRRLRTALLRHLPHLIDSQNRPGLTVPNQFRGCALRRGESLLHETALERLADIVRNPVPAKINEQRSIGLTAHGGDFAEFLLRDRHEIDETVRAMMKRLSPPDFSFSCTSSPTKRIHPAAKSSFAAWRAGSFIADFFIGNV
jgi:hypothetical protein